jgi:hypothetical protein
MNTLNSLSKKFGAKHIQQLPALALFFSPPIFDFAPGKQIAILS